MTKDKFEQMVATLREEYILEPGDRPDIEEFIGYASRGFEPPRPFVQAGEIKEEDWKSARPGLVTFVPPEALCSGWIACAERLPELGAQVLIWPYAKSGNKYDSPVGYYDEYGVLKKDRRREFKCFGEFIKVTHWQPLPSFPSPLAEKPGG